MMVIEEGCKRQLESWSGPAPRLSAVENYVCGDFFWCAPFRNMMVKRHQSDSLQTLHRKETSVVTSCLSPSSSSWHLFLEAPHLNLLFEAIIIILFLFTGLGPHAAAPSIAGWLWKLSTGNRIRPGHLTDHEICWSGPTTDRLLSIQQQHLTASEL